MRARDGWALFFCLTFFTFALIPIIARVEGVDAFVVELEAAQWYIPPEAPVSGDPWSWKYKFSFRSFCRTFVIYDGKDLFEEDIDCTTLGLGYTFNLTERWIADNVNASATSDKNLAHMLERIDLKTASRLYVMGFAFGLLSVLSTIYLVLILENTAMARKFTFNLVGSRFVMIILDYSLKVVSFIFMIASIALIQLLKYPIGNPSSTFLGMCWTEIVSLFFLLFIAMMDIWAERGKINRSAAIPVPLQATLK